MHSIWYGIPLEIFKIEDINYSIKIVNISWSQQFVICEEEYKSSNLLPAWVSIQGGGGGGGGRGRDRWAMNPSININ